MFKTMQNAITRQIKAFVLSCHGWKRRQGRRLGQLSIQWRDPHSGLWYHEGTALQILSAEAMAPYNRS